MNLSFGVSVGKLYALSYDTSSTETVQTAITKPSKISYKDVASSKVLST